MEYERKKTKSMIMSKDLEIEQLRVTLTESENKFGASKQLVIIF
jgi:hypothetical protein